jgi:hypothetical protein
MRRLGFVIPRGKAMLDFGDDRRSVESNLARGAIAPSAPSRRASECIAGDRSRFALNGSRSAVPPSLILTSGAAGYDFIGRRGRPAHFKKAAKDLADVLKLKDA